VHGELAGYVPGDVPAVAPGALAHLVLSRGLVVTLHITDPQGRPARAQDARAGAGSGAPSGAPVDAIYDDESLQRASATWQFSGLTPCTLAFVVDVGGRQFTLEHDTRLPDATLVVPAFGSLLVHGLQAAKDKPDASVGRFDAASNEGVFQKLNLGHIAHDRVSWPVVFAGRYRLELRSGDTVLGTPVDLEVRAGETTDARFP
jgi:hypothetical protein